MGVVRVLTGSKPRERATTMPFSKSAMTGRNTQRSAHDGYFGLGARAIEDADRAETDPLNPAGPCGSVKWVPAKIVGSQRGQGGGPPVDPVNWLNDT